MRLQVLLKYIMGWSLLAPVADDGARALDYLAGLALLVNLAQTSPLTKLHVGINLNNLFNVYKLFTTIYNVIDTEYVCFLIKEMAR